MGAMNRATVSRRFGLLTFGLACSWITGCGPYPEGVNRESGSKLAAHRCSLSKENRIARRRVLERDLIPFIERTEQLDDGFRVWFGGDAASARRVFDFVRFERRCCNFLRYEITFEPSDGPISLALRGDAEAMRGMKELLDEAMAARSRKDQRGAS